MSGFFRRSLKFALCASLLPLTAEIANAQCTEWVQVPRGEEPALSGAMAFDAGRGQAMGLGTRNNCCPPDYGVSCACLWNGKHWASCESDAGPAQRIGHAVVYDDANDYVLLVGGRAVGSNPVWLNETWSWDGTGWTYLGNRPATARYPNNGMAYDAARREVVLFGGSAIDNNYDNETWVWNGTNWSQKFPSVAPSGRTGNAMAYDAARQVVVLFGGGNFDGFLDDTWEWNGNSWTQRSPSEHPPALNSPTIAYDSVRHVTVLFGGYLGGGVYSNQTWEWDGNSWQLQTPSVRPPTRSKHAMFYDSRRGRIVIVGGFGSDGNILRDVWEYPVVSYPRIFSQSISQTVCLGGSVTFTVTAGGDAPLTYRWRRNGVDLNLPGAQTPTLTITSADFGSMGNYTCVVSNSCGSVESAPAPLSVCAGVGGCPQPLDVNGDGIVDGADIQRFVEVLLGQ